MKKIQSKNEKIIKSAVKNVTPSMNLNDRYKL